MITAIEHRPTHTLQPHPINATVYGDAPDNELLDSVRAHGILTPLVITVEGTIISGHRRWLAAKAAGLATVPVVISPLSDDLDVREAVIEANRQRSRITEQRAREYIEIKAIEAERARRRQLASLKQGATPPVPVILPEREKGDSRDIAAAKVGMSGKTAEKAAAVAKAIDHIEGLKRYREWVAEQITKQELT